MTNSPTTLMGLINRDIDPYLDIFFYRIHDDILIYSRNEKDHSSHLRVAFQILIHRELYSKFYKCGFLHVSMAFLGHIVSGKGIQFDTTRWTQ